MTKIIKYLITHHSAVSYKVNSNQFEAINRFHKEKWHMQSSLGYWGGYNYIIAMDGSVRQYRADNEETIGGMAPEDIFCSVDAPDPTHSTVSLGAVGHNFDSIHVCLEGNFSLEDERPTFAQKTALTNFLKQKAKQYNVPIENIVPHRKFANKDCYGSKLPDDWAQKLLGDAFPAVSAPDLKKNYLERFITLMRELLAKLLLQKNMRLGFLGHLPSEKRKLGGMNPPEAQYEELARLARLVVIAVVSSILGVLAVQLPLFDFVPDSSVDQAIITAVIMPLIEQARKYFASLQD